MGYLKLVQIYYLISKFRTSKIVKNDIFRPFEFAKIWIHKENRSDGKIIFEQSQALTLHFESF